MDLIYTIREGSHLIEIYKCDKCGKKSIYLYELVKVIDD